VDYFLRNKPSVIGLMHAVHDGIAHMIVADSDVFLLRSQTVHLCVTSLMTAPSCVSWTEALCLSDCLYTALPRWASIWPQAARWQHTLTSQSRLQVGY